MRDICYIERFPDWVETYDALKGDFTEPSLFQKHIDPNGFIGVIKPYTKMTVWMLRNAHECMIEHHVWHEKDTLESHVHSPWDNFEHTPKYEYIKWAANRLIWC